MKTTYQITAKQLVVLALVTALVAASAVVFYDRVGTGLLGHLVGAKSDKIYTDTPTVAADPAVLGDEANNKQVYDAAGPGRGQC